MSRLRTLSVALALIHLSLSGQYYTKNHTPYDLPMAVVEIEMSSFAPFGGLARCGLLFRLQIGFVPCVRHDTPNALDDRRERLRKIIR